MIVVTIHRWSVHSLSRCVHTLDQVELDSEHAPSSSSRVSFGRYLKSASTRVPESASTRINRSSLWLVFCKVAESLLQLALCGVAKSALRLAFMQSCGVRASACVICSCGICTLCKVSSVLPLKLDRSGIINPRSAMNCQSLSAPKALVKMSSI